MSKRKKTVLLEPPIEVITPLWMSVSESAKILGVQTKTIRRAIEAARVKFKVVGNRYLINLASLISFALDATKVRNKFQKTGLGQYVDKWRSTPPTI